jgi:cellulose synthase/poly-beta-1,6-N-acetylglucosamine synthase-like glycosyltransferase
MLIGIIITICYLVLIVFFVYGLGKTKEFHLKGIPSKTKFSVVIPFRNESENLPVLLKSIEFLNYPNDLFEVLLVDDESDDESVEIVEAFLSTCEVSMSLISNERKTNSPKKDAITSAIKQAKFDWIVTTDADCILPKYWLNSFDEFIQSKDASCIAAPVMYDKEESFLNEFQILDMLSLQGATIGGFGIKKPFLCNGANFAYKKTLFNSLNGFDGNSDIASGDDIFFLEKVIKTQPEQLGYLKCKEAIVMTLSQPSWRSLIAQRKRWTSKTSAYNNGFGKLTGLLVILMNGLLISSLLLLIGDVINLKALLFLVFVKLIVDFVLIFKSATFFSQKNILKSYLKGFVLYPFFSIYIVIVSMFSKYKWKERTFNQ